MVPMDEALAEVALDLSGRAAVVFGVRFSGDKIGTFDTQLVEEFCRRLATKAGMTLHVNVPYGSNDHHVAEAIFKALAQALRVAKEIDPRRSRAGSLHQGHAVEGTSHPRMRQCRRGPRLRRVAPRR